MLLFCVKIIVKESRVLN